MTVRTLISQLQALDPSLWDQPVTILVDVDDFYGQCPLRGIEIDDDVVILTML